MKQYSVFMFEMNFANNNEVGMKKFQKVRKPNNWEVVLEFSLNTVLKTENYGFDVPTLCYQLHIFKVDEFRLFADQAFNRIHVHSSEVFEFLNNRTTNGMLEYCLSSVSAQWALDYPVQFENEKAQLLKNKLESTSAALEQVENVVKSISKRDPNKLMKSDFSFITTDSNGRWRAFYPAVNMLIDYHLTKPVSDQDTDYLKFLESETLKQLRENWSTQIGVTPGE